MKWPLVVLLATGLSRPAAAEPIAIEADLGSFFHQVEIAPGPSGTRLRQVVSPVEVRIPFLGGQVEALSAAMYIERAKGDSTADVLGPLDTRLRGVWTFGRATLSAHASLPTGKSALDPQDSLLVRDLHRGDLNFPVKTFGQGLDVGGTMALAHQSGPMGLSLGVSALVRGDYVPYASGPTYKPGDEVSATAGIDYTSGGWNAGFDVAGTFLFTDRADGLVVFQNGKQITGRVSASYGASFFRAAADVVAIMRYRNRSLGSGGHLLFEDRDSHGSDVRATAEAAWSPHRALSVFATGLLRNLDKNAYQPGSPAYGAGSRIYGYGGGVSVGLGPGERLLLHAQRQTGWVDGGAAHLRALNVRVAVTVEF